MEFKLGSRRVVLLIGKYAIKIPRLNNWVSFIKGICENLEERYWWSADGSRKRDPKRKWEHKFLAEIYWADRFGFCVVMERCCTDFVFDRYSIKEGTDIRFLIDYDKLMETIKYLPIYPDVRDRVDNVGYTKDGRLVVIDYGYHGGTRDCYLGS